MPILNTSLYSMKRGLYNISLWTLMSYLRRWRAAAASIKPKSSFPTLELKSILVIFTLYSSYGITSLTKMIRKWQKNWGAVKLMQNHMVFVLECKKTQVNIILTLKAVISESLSLFEVNTKSLTDDFDQSGSMPYDCVRLKQVVLSCYRSIFCSSRNS